MLSSVKWIKPANDYGFSPIYIKNFTLVGEVKNATIDIDFSKTRTLIKCIVAN